MGTSFEEARATGKARLVIAYFGPASPGPLGDGGVPRGLEPEMMNFFVHHVADEYGIEVEVEWRPFPTFRDILDEVAAARGAVFGINQISATAERAKRLTFSPPYLKSVAVLVTGADQPEATTHEELVEALRGRTAVTIPLTTFAGFVEEWKSGPLPDLEIEWVESAANVPTAVRDDPEGVFGYVDYALYVFSLKGGIPLRRHAIADRDTEPLAVAMPKGSDWAPVIERFLDAETGFPSEMAWELLVRRYIGPELVGNLRP